MSKQPFLPLFFGDFLASTAEWSGEEASLYLTLLGHQWTLGTLPADAAKLARIVRWERKAFEKCWPQVSSKFEAKDGRLVNARLEQHRVKADEVAEKNRTAGRKGAESRWRKDGERHSDNMASAIEPLCHPIQSNPIQSRVLPPSSQDSCVSASTARADTRTRAERPTNADWEAVKAAYPKGAGMPNWITAQHHWHLRIDDGCGAADLLAAVKRYRAYVDGGGVSSTAFVMQPAKFFSDSNKPWQQQWDLPKPIESAANVGVLSAVKWRPTDDESTTDGARASA